MKNVLEKSALYLLTTCLTEERQDEVPQMASLVRGSDKVSGVFYSAHPGEWFSV